MMKWLRKHSKQIMVALVLIAMFSFVGGSALVNILSPKGNQTFAKAFGHDLTYKQLEPAQRDATVLERIGIPWRLLGGRGMEAYHWYMLRKEAENAGITVTDSEVESMMDSLAKSGLNAGVLQQLRLRHGIAVPEIKLALSNFLAVNKNANRVAAASIPSEQEMRHYASDTEEKIKVRFVSLDAQSFVDKERPVTEEELQAQFEKYKEVDAGQGETGYGYRLPRRVKLQYILASIPDLQAQVQVTIEEATAYWRANKDKYKKVDYIEEPTASAPAATAPAAGDQAASQPTTQTSQPSTQPAKKRVEREKTFTEAKPDVTRDLQKQKAAKLADQGMRKAVSLLLKPWDNQKPDPKTGFKPIPPEVQAPDYLQKINEQVSREVGVELACKETPLLSREKLASWPDLRSVKIAGKEADRLPLSDYAFNIPAFLDQKVRRETSAALQLYQIPDAPLTAEAGGRYAYVDGKIVPTPGPVERYVIFRVVEAQDEAMPNSLADVREDVENDVRLARAYEEIKPISEELCLTSHRLGLDKALELFDDLRSKHGIRKPTAPPAFARRVSMGKSKQDQNKYMDNLLEGKPTLVPPNISGIGPSEEFVAACFRMIQPDWKPPEIAPTAGDRVQAATTRPAASPQPVVDIVSLPKLRKRLVVELLNSDLINQQKFDSELKKSVYDDVSAERNRILLTNWFKPENIEKRCRFTPLGAGSAGTTDEGVLPPMPTAPPPEPAPEF